MKLTAKSIIKNAELIQEHEVMKTKRHHDLYENYGLLEESSELLNSKKHLIREDCKPRSQLEYFKKLHKLNQVKSDVNRKSRKINR